MRALSEAQILHVWEQGRGRDPQYQALVVLTVALPDRSGDELARLALGARDRLLLELRAQTLGPSMPAAATCPQCGAIADFEVVVDDLLAVGGDASGLAEIDARPQEHRFDFADLEVHFRLLDSRDLAWAASTKNLPETRARLIWRTFLGASRDGVPMAWDALPPDAIVALGEALDDRDPLVVLQLAVDCGRCTLQWLPQLDLASFVWHELASRAERVVYDVHTLAQAYGWSETEVLAMSSERRQYYLELAPQATPNAEPEAGNQEGR